MSPVSLPNRKERSQMSSQVSSLSWVRRCWFCAADPLEGSRGVGRTVSSSCTPPLYHSGLDNYKLQLTFLKLQLETKHGGTLTCNPNAWETWGIEASLCTAIVRSVPTTKPAGQQAGSAGLTAQPANLTHWDPPGGSEEPNLTSSP